MKLRTLVTLSTTIAVGCGPEAEAPRMWVAPRARSTPARGAVQDRGPRALSLGVPIRGGHGRMERKVERDSREMPSIRSAAAT